MPFEVLKVRLQLAQGTVYSRGQGMNILFAVAENEGLGALYKGLSPGVARQVLYCGGKLSVFEPMRDAYNTIMGGQSFFTSMLAGGTAGALGNFMSNPADLMKVRFQADTTGHFQRQGLFRCWRDSIRNEGLVSLWCGCQPTVLRAFFINSVELGGYDVVKRALAPHFTSYNADDIRLHLLCGVISGILASIVSLPFDVIKSRMMVSGSEFRTISQCVKTTIAREGVGAFFKGFVPIASRIIPFNVIQFMLFEQSRRLLSGEYL